MTPIEARIQRQIDWHLERLDYPGGMHYNERARIEGKVEGLKLALSCVREPNVRSEGAQGSPITTGGTTDGTQAV